MDGKQGLKELALQYMGKGKEAIKENRLDEAIQMLQDAVHLFKRCEDEWMYARCLDLLGITYENTGNIFMAVDSYLEGLEIAKSREYYLDMAIFYNNIGIRYQKLGEYKTAIKFLEKSEAALMSEKDREEEYYVQLARTYLNLSLSHNKISNVKFASNYLEQAKLIIKEHKITKYSHIVMILTCNISWKMGDLDFVRNHVPILLKTIKGDKELSEYVQMIQETAVLLKTIKEYDAWKRLLQCGEKEAEIRNNLYFCLICAEMWIDYYHTIKDMDSYFNVCVDYIELFRKQKKVNDSHQILALDLKLALREMEAQRRILEKESKQDIVTGIRNRHSLELESRIFVQEAVEKDMAIIVGIIDIDYFKQVNDTYGHVQGDRCLKLSAQVIEKSIHGYGKVYRYGGDEFVLLITEGSEEVACRLAERIRQRISETKVRKGSHNSNSQFTVSQGYACFKPREGERLADILSHADKALYTAKDSGRDNYKVIMEKDQ